MMTGAQLAAARETLGRTVREMAYDLAVTEDEIRAWEAAGGDLIPLRQARDVKLFLADNEWMEAAGVPECPWNTAWEKQPMPDRLSDQVEHIRRRDAHAETCGTCLAFRRRMEEMWPSLADPPPPPPAPPSRLAAAWKRLIGRGKS
ncbi:hypothetical protein [Longimicrobium terrae]|uniref:Uncharacterized protein n=1 Tax=Longimicrobium terrae TaxID=1639882 RepID=A0A841GU83_9BACT|nr:hypothetical protein [Longimicrobium terrae]MBB4634232.1 hypothetical protein [Longimicrobium terrae]MBB6068878.1 hypothetical protein [Longimicrobium terrae]NNC28058.1 hypothetical protein [Longimicrobium terrae]